MFDTARKLQAPALIRALRYSYGISASPSTARKASQLAPTVRAIRPAVYLVGDCVVDMWLMKCTCKAERMSGQKHTCPHWVALYLAGEWFPLDSDPTLYYKTSGIEQPQIIAFYAHIKGVKGTRRVWATTSQTHDSKRWFCHEALNDESNFGFCLFDDIQHLTPFYE